MFKNRGKICKKLGLNGKDFFVYLKPKSSAIVASKNSYLHHQITKINTHNINESIYSSINIVSIAQTLIIKHNNPIDHKKYKINSQTNFLILCEND